MQYRKSSELRLIAVSFFLKKICQGFQARNLSYQIILNLPQIVAKLVGVLRPQLNDRGSTLVMLHDSSHTRAQGTSSIPRVALNTTN